MSGDIQIWEIPLPEVTEEEYFKALGANYGKRSPRPATLEIYRRMLQEAGTIVQPKAIWREAKIVSVGEQVVLLEEGYKLTSRLVAKVAGKADKLLIFASTVGREIDGVIDRYQKAGRMTEAFSLDAAATAYIAKSSGTALTKLEARYLANGLQTTFNLGPGHSYWPGREDLRALFGLLQPEQIGLTLTDSNLMMPRKSIAMVMGVGHDFAEFYGKTHCDFCNLQKTCNMNKFGHEC